MLSLRPPCCTRPNPHPHGEPHCFRQVSLWLPTEPHRAIVGTVPSQIRAAAQNTVLVPHLHVGNTHLRACARCPRGRGRGAPSAEAALGQGQQGPRCVGCPRTAGARVDSWECWWAHPGRVKSWPRGLGPEGPTPCFLPNPPPDADPPPLPHPRAPHQPDASLHTPASAPFPGNSGHTCD